MHGLRAAGTSTHSCAKERASLQGKLESFEETVVQFASGAGTVIVDGDNVRGKSGFSVSHMELVRATSIWADQRGLEGRLVVCIDHGSSADAWYLSELGVAVCFAWLGFGFGLGFGLVLGLAPNPNPSPDQVCFAGPVGTADDLIANRAVPCFAHALVITADAGLAKRCRSAARGR